MVRLLPMPVVFGSRQKAKFQSHNGAIAAVLNLRRQVSFSTVSIPQWCDCCEQIRETLLRRGLSFNPTMVRLLRNARQLRLQVGLEFQSHNGAIAALTTSLIASQMTPFQSHNGAIAA